MFFVCRQQRVVHDQLPVSAGQGHPREVQHHRRSDDDRALVHGDAEDGRRAEQQGLARRSNGRHQHHPVGHWSRQGRRKGDSEPQRKTDWNGFPCSNRGRVRRRPHLPHREGGESVSYVIDDRPVLWSKQTAAENIRWYSRGAMIGQPVNYTSLWICTVICVIRI